MAIKIDDKGIVHGLVVQREWKTTNDWDNEASMSASIDLSGMHIRDLGVCATRDLIIKRQRVERKLSVPEIEAHKGETIHWSQMGLKIKSREEKIAEVQGLTGVTREVAEMIVDNPGHAQAAAQAIQASVDAEKAQKAKAETSDK